MLGVYCTVPVACFRKGLAREYLETEPLPPPATCYGFLLSLVGEPDRGRHVGARVAPVLLNAPALSVVLRTVWRNKDKNYWLDPAGRGHVVPDNKKERGKFGEWAAARGYPEPEYVVGMGSGTNARPDYQQLLTGPSRSEPFTALLMWVDSTGEVGPAPALEDRVRSALTDPAGVTRWGGLSLGESAHMVDEVCLWDRVRDRFAGRPARAFLLADRGRLTLPVWVDHVGSAGTRYATGNLDPYRPGDAAPDPSVMPRIGPE